MRVLVLGGTTEARVLAGEIVAAHDVTVSLAGRVRSPLPLPGRVRIGGFGGVDGLAAWLRAHRTDVVVDATHPFASTMTAHADVACAEVGVPLLRLQRPAWTPVDGDDWRLVADLPAAAAVADGLGERIFLTTGRSGLAVEGERAAARERGVPVVMVGRPPLPRGVIAVPTVAAARDWVNSGGG